MERGSSWTVAALVGGAAAVATSWILLRRAPVRSLAALNAALASRQFRPANPRIAGLLSRPSPPVSPDAAPDRATARVLNYNVLADGPFYGLTGAPYTPMELRVADSRYPRIVRELESYGADVVGLQEVQTHFLSDFLFARGSPFAGTVDHTLNDRSTERELAKLDEPRPFMERNGDSLFSKTATFETLESQVIPFFSLTDAYFRALTGRDAPALPSSLDPALLRDQPRSTRAAAAAAAAAASAAATADSNSTVVADSPAAASSPAADPDAPMIDLLGRMHSRGDGVIVSLLRHRVTGRRLLVANSHIYYNPKSPEIKSVQAALMGFALRTFARARGFQLDGDEDLAPEARNGVGATDSAHGSAAADGARESVPFVIMGDLNALAFKRARDQFDTATDDEYAEARARAEEAEADLHRRVRSAPGIVSGVVEVLTRGVLPPSHHEHPSRRALRPELPALRTFITPVQSVYRVARGADPPITTRTATFEGCLDYIFVSPSVRVLNVLDMPYPVERVDAAGTRAPAGDDWSGVAVVPPTAAAFAPVPDAAWASDHLLIGADIEF